MSEFKWNDELIREAIHILSMKFAAPDLYSSEWRGIDYEIEQFKASKQPKPLFTTEDGVDVFMGKTYYKVTSLEQCWKVDETVMREALVPPPIYFKYFSTKEAAEQYILENKPCLSLKDISFADAGTLTWSKFKEELRNIAKSKLTGS